MKQLNLLKRCAACAAAIMLVLCGAGQICVPVAAYSSVTTGSAMNAAVSALPQYPDPAEVDALAQDLRNLPQREYRYLRASTIERLSGFYNSQHGVAEATYLYYERSEVSSNDRVAASSPSRSAVTVYGLGIATYADNTTVTLELEQVDASGNEKLRFHTIVTGGGSTSLSGPILVYINRPDSLRTSRDYYVTGGSWSSDVRHSSGDLGFLIDSVGTWRLRQSGSSSSYDDDDDDWYDDDYEVSSFWSDVIDEIQDADSGDTVRVNIGSRTSVPTAVLYELRDLRVTLVLRTSSGRSYHIYGRDIGYLSSSRNRYSLSSLSHLDDDSSGYSNGRVPVGGSSADSVSGTGVTATGGVATGILRIPGTLKTPPPSSSGGVKTENSVLSVRNETPIVVVADGESSTPDTTGGMVIATDDQVTSQAPAAAPAQTPQVQAPASSQAVQPPASSSAPEKATSSTASSEQASSSSSEAAGEGSGGGSKPKPVLTGGNDLSGSSSSSSKKETASSKPQSEPEDDEEDASEAASGDLRERTVSFPVFITVILVLAAITIGSLTFAITSRMRRR